MDQPTLMFLSSQDSTQKPCIKFDAPEVDSNPLPRLVCYPSLISFRCWITCLLQAPLPWRQFVSIQRQPLISENLYTIFLGRDDFLAVGEPPRKKWRRDDYDSVCRCPLLRPEDRHAGAV